METVFLWGVAIVAFAISVFASLAEGAIFFHAPSRLEDDPDERRRIERFLPHLDRYLFSAKLLIILADVVLVALVASWVVHSAIERAEPVTLGPVFAAIAVATVIVLLLAEAVPRALSQAYADRLLSRVLPGMAALDRAFVPILGPLYVLKGWLLKAAMGPEEGEERAADHIRNATLEAERKGVLDEEDAEMIESIIEFRSSEVREVMTPRTDMHCLEVNCSLEEAVRDVVARGHSRIPVYEGSRDRIVGILYAKDLLAADVKARDRRAARLQAAMGSGAAGNGAASSGSAGHGAAGNGASGNGVATHAGANGGGSSAAPGAGASRRRKLAAAGDGAARRERENGGVAVADAPERERERTPAAPGRRVAAAAAASAAAGAAAGAGSEEGADDGEPTLRALLRKPFFVPATKPVGELLKEFRVRKVHMAVVLDEYGGTAGVVTIEDILEEIVGEIEDEYDEAEGLPIQRVDAVTADCDAKLHVYELNKELELSLPEDGEFETLGGFVLYSLGKVPQVGEAFTAESARFTVLDADERRVNRVRVERLEPAAAD